MRAIRRDIRKPGYLGLLVLMQFVEAVVHLHDLYRLDEDSLAAGALVIHDAGDAVLVGRRHRYKGLSVPHRNPGVLVHIAFALRLLQDGGDDFGNRLLLLPDQPSDAGKGVGSVVPDIAVTVDDGVDAAADFGEISHGP